MLLTVIYDDEVEALLRHEKIYASIDGWRTSGAFTKGQTIKFSGDLKLERYSFPGRALSPLGAFSYNRSPAFIRTEIGRYCSIADHVSVMGPAHPLDRISSHVFTYRSYFNGPLREEFGQTPEIKAFDVNKKPVQIGNDVWIGEQVTFKPGVCVGDGAVIASGAVVVEDVKPYEIVGGVPAKRIRMRFDDETIAQLLELQWWKFNCADFAGLDVTAVSAFISALREKLADGSISPWDPGFVSLGAKLDEIGQRQKSAIS